MFYFMYLIVRSAAGVADYVIPLQAMRLPLNQWRLRLSINLHVATTNPTIAATPARRQSKTTEATAAVDVLAETAPVVFGSFSVAVARMGGSVLGIARLWLATSFSWPAVITRLTLLSTTML